MLCVYPASVLSHSHDGAASLTESRPTSLSYELLPAENLLSSPTAINPVKMQTDEGPGWRGTGRFPYLQLRDSPAQTGHPRARPKVTSATYEQMNSCGAFFSKMILSIFSATKQGCQVFRIIHSISCAHLALFNFQSEFNLWFKLFSCTLHAAMKSRV